MAIEDTSSNYEYKLKKYGLAEPLSTYLSDPFDIDRLDAGFTAFSDSGLVGKTGQIASLKRHIQPIGFNAPTYLNGIAALSVNGAFSATVDAYDLIDTSSYVNTIYVDGVGGSDANTGATWALRKRSIGNALRAASTSGLPTRILVWAKSGLPYYRQISCSDDGASRVSTVPILLESMNGRVKTGPFDNLVWAKTGGLTYTYQSPRTNTTSCFNTTILDEFGLYKEYTWAASSAAVDAAEGSWFTDGTTVFVHPHNHATPDIYTARVYVIAAGLEWKCNQNLVIRGFDFEGGFTGAIRVSDGSTNTIVSDDCTFRYASLSNANIGGGTSVIDGAQVLGCGLFAGFNSSADRNSKDGFNFHIGGTDLPTALLVNCKASLNGRSPSVSNNGFTTHDGVKAISIGCDWRSNYGTGSGHVNNDTQVWSVGDISGASMGDTIFSGSIPYAGFGAWSGNATVWLDSCRDVGAQYGLFQGDTAVLNVRDHKGSGRKTGTISTY